MRKTLNFLTSLVWIINGLYCKILNQVPRHTEIVSRLLSKDYARELTIVIGCSEILMSIWILTKIQSKWNAWTQISIVLIMNIIEFSFASDLLLWGKINIVFALIFCFVVYFNEYKLNKTSS